MNINLQETIDLLSRQIDDRKLPINKNYKNNELDYTQLYDINLIEKSFAELGVQIKDNEGNYLGWDHVFEQLSDVFYKNEQK